MKENIYTIPLNDAFSTDCECPICEFIKKEEASRVEYALGASMMEPDERILSNELGYCQRHTQQMFNFGNKLSHALVLETRLKYLTDSLVKYRKKAVVPVKTLLGTQKKTVLNDSKTCVVCTRLEKILGDFISNLFYLYKKDDEFKAKFLSSKGFCVPHFEYIANKAYENFKGQALAEFMNELCDLQQKNLERVIEDVEWFTKKFDYRYRDEDWKNSKDAVIRGCQKISGYIEE